MPGEDEEARAGLLDAAAAIARDNLPRENARVFERFLLGYYSGVPYEDLAGRSPEDVYGAALAHWDLARTRAPGRPEVRVYTPRLEQHGWRSSHTVIEVVNDDMPFLVDSTRNEISRHGLGIHLVLHPIFPVRRDASGAIAEVFDAGSPAPEGAVFESFMHFEVDRVGETAELGELRTDLLRVLDDVRAAVEDWQPMRARLHEVAAELATRPPPVDPEELAEAAELLAWLADDHFTFLGYRAYELDRGGEELVLRALPGSGLGILRREPPSATSFAGLPEEIGRRALERNLLILTKANSRATVHRPSRLDYVGIKRFDDHGDVLGEHRFLGLYTSTAYNTSPTQIPVLRSKYRRVIERAGFPPGTHSRKDLETVLESHPRDELFQSTVDELYDAAMAILHLQERQRLRLIVRRDAYGRFFSCLVFLPRDRYNTDSRRRIQKILTEAFHGTDVDYATQVSESVLARLHYVIYSDPKQPIHYDVAAIESRLEDAIRTWTDRLRAALIAELGEERGLQVLGRYGESFPPGYQETTAPRRAVVDIEHLERLDPARGLDTSLYRPMEAPSGALRFKLYTTGERVMLSDILPRLEHMGVKVVDEHPHEVHVDGAVRWIYDLGLTCPDPDALQSDRARSLFQELFKHVWEGSVEDDGFNRLVVVAGLGWRDIVILRAYFRYMRQAGSLFSQSYVEDALAGNPAVARDLIALFHRRFDPDLPADERQRAAQVDELGGRIEHALDDVASLDEDRILRAYLALIRATLRTNLYQRDDRGRPKAHLSFKLDPHAIPDLPLPRPEFEIFVHSPRTEGVHLRGGKVARGGIRWSDRREDFRTEVLGLMKAQQVKNSIIVPVGAKGGFVVKRPPPDGDRDALLAEVQECYRTLIRGLLDLTDNLVDGGVRPPPRVVRYDGDDTYLVVAADKGTATFSDIANDISAAYGYWLGDAFASGGSTGYDHKEMGITARGAWVSVARHLRELGVDVDRQDFTMVGIGDMSGDVFGNGALRSEHIKLIAAFDHRHVFIDPDPDPRASFAERRRLFELPRSSWDDYDRALLSEGGGIYPRTAKSIALSPQARDALGIEADRLTPNEVVSAILRAPVDVLFNGGIGTFVKAGDESHAEVGDRTNDAVRVNAGELRCRVVGEGGNLGFTQRARVEFALAGGRINTDSIDNSAGVDCSDHEVNIKILLDAVVAAGDLTVKQRNELLADMTDEVAGLVLSHNHDQARALAHSVAQAPAMISVHERYIRALERSGRLDRHLEFLPGDDELAARRERGKGLTSPEFAILLAYTKLDLKDRLLASDVPEDRFLARYLERYFPRRLRDRFAGRIAGHPLRREIIATEVANDIVDSEGTTFVFRLGEETGAGAEDIVRAATAAFEVLGSRELRADIEALGSEVPADVQTEMVLEVRKLAERVARWLLRHVPGPLDVSEVVAAYGPGCAELAGRLAALVRGADRRRLEATASSLRANGVPDDLAARVAVCPAMSSAPDIVDVARATGAAVDDAASAFLILADELQLAWLRDRILGLPRAGRWQTLARDALRSDLSGWHQALAVEAMGSGPSGAGPEERVQAWLQRDPERMRRYKAVIGDIQSAGESDLATMAVALRAVRALASTAGRPRTAVADG